MELEELKPTGSIEVSFDHAYLKPTSLSTLRKGSWFLRQQCDIVNRVRPGVLEFWKKLR